MKNSQLKNTLDLLLIHPESEVVEFKEAKNQFDFSKLGKYFSALSNEANLRGFESAWLIFGVNNNGKTVGTDFCSASKDLHSLKFKVATKTNGNTTFREIYELNTSKGRVILFEIPPAHIGVPTTFDGHAYAREADSLVALNQEKHKRFYNQIAPDWSAQIIENAILDDLDPEALKKARADYKIKNAKYAGEVDNWDDITFLNKAKITIQGKITNTAILLLGKNESQHFLSPSISQITWIVHNDKGDKIDYEHFHLPFILTSDAVLKKIRNLNYRYMPENTLFPLEMRQYDINVIREALHNCIAHQDYLLKERILVLEYPDYLFFENGGSFIPESVENVIRMNSPARFYRNPFLCEAMVNLNMIDTIGSGIKKMFTIQRERYFPLPDYDLKRLNTVKVKIYGSIINKQYTEALLKKGDLAFEVVMALDKVQKHENIDVLMAKKLKAMGLIEGRKPHYLVSFHLADNTQKKVAYLKNKAFDDTHYKNMILKYIKTYKQAKRAELDVLLIDKLPDILTAEQKQNKITNLIQALKKQKKIKKVNNSNRGAIWALGVE